MRLRFPIVGLAAFAAAALARPPAPAMASDAVPTACRKANGGSTAFTPEKRQCYGTLYAQGRYAEVIDRIRVIAIGTSPQDLYFFGASYLGLSTREASGGLKCVYAARARESLTAFLARSQDLFAATGTFGSAEDMTYVDAATKMLASLRSVGGCEASSYTSDELTRFTLRYGRARARNLVFDTGANDPAMARVREAMASISEQMRGLTSKAVQLESRVGSYDAEIQSDVASLKQTAVRLGVFAPGLVKISAASAGEIPSFAYDAAVRGDVLRDIDKKTSFIALAKAAVDEERGRVLATMNATDYGAYFDLKKATVKSLSEVAADLLHATNTWTSVRATNGWADVVKADATPPGSTLAAKAAAAETVWTGTPGAPSKPRAWCRADRPQWYCKKTGGA